MRPTRALRWAVPTTLVVTGSAFAASPTLDGSRDVLYDAVSGGSFDVLTSQQASVIEIFSPPFAFELQADNSNYGGVGAFTDTNFKGEPVDVLTGFELEIPLDEIGWDTFSPIKICAFLNGRNSDFLSNQVSGGLVPGTPEGDGANLGGPVFVFDDGYGVPAVVGDQFVTVTNTQSTVSMTIDGVADEVEWSDNGSEPLLYVNGIQSAPGTENPTGFADNNDDDEILANGSEIDAVRAFRTDSHLYLHIAGNMESNFNKLEIFIDCSVFGPNQYSLPAPPSPDYAGTSAMAGSLFDSTFAADYYLRYTRGGSPGDGNNCGGNACQFLDAVDLDNVGATAGQDPLTDLSTPMSFTGPSPFGGTITAQMDNSNIAGISAPGGGDGADVAYPDPLVEPSDVSTGVEFSIDLDALGWDGARDIRIGGFLNAGDQMSNQVIGGLPSNTEEIGPGDGADFSAIAGDQFVTITPADTGPAPTIDGSLSGDSYTQLWVNENNGTGNSTTLGDLLPAASNQGACCLLDDTCKILTSADCAAVFGSYAGNGTTCAGAPTLCGGTTIGPDADPGVSEIDGVYAVINGTTLYVLVTGNFGGYHRLGVFLDTEPGGQNVIRSDNPYVSGNFYNNLAGMTWDAAFVPNFSIVYNLGTDNGFDGLPGGGDDFVEHFADGVELATNGAADNPTGGLFDGGPKTSTNLVGDLVYRSGFGDNSDTGIPYANGSELDNVSAYVDEEHLWLFIGGNLESNFTKLEIFLDIIPEEIGDPMDPDDNYGGQNTLIYDEDPPLDEMGMPNPNYEGNCDLDYQALNRLGGPVIFNQGEPDEFIQPGFTFDTGFTADHYVFVTVGGDDLVYPGEPEWFAGSQRLRDSLPEDPNFPGAEDPGECNFWGSTSITDGGAFLGYGETALLFVNNSNVGGVDGGPDQFEPDVSNPASVATGIEVAIPLEEILVPGTDPFIPEQWDGSSNFKLCIFINGHVHSFVSNQFLQSICDTELGEPREIDLEAEHPGLQYMELTPNGIPPMVSYVKISPDPEPCTPQGGACCVGTSCVTAASQDECENSLGGLYLGDGTDCVGNPCAPQGGACCIGTTCVDVPDQSVCVVFAGVYQGDGTSCTSDPCTPTSGACCFSCPDTNVCIDGADESACLAAEGTYIGDGTVCASIDCESDCCIADLDGDGDVDVFDFGIFAPNFGASGAGRCQGDFDCDGDVDVFDFGVFGPNFGCIGLVPHASCP